MNYSEVIEKAWKIIWRFKILWVLGLLASCSGGVVSTPSFNYSMPAANFPFAGDGNGVASEIARWFLSVPIWVWIVLGLGILLLSLLIFCIGLVGRAGVKRGAWLADTGAETLSLGELVKESLGYFWRMLGLTLLVGLPGFLFSLISAAFIIGGIFSVVGSTESRNFGGAALLCIGVPLICLIIPLSWLLGMLSELCSAALVGENLGVIASLRRGWDLLWKKLGSVILISILIFVAQFGIGLVLSIPAALLVLPVVFAAVMARASGLAIWLGIIALGALAAAVGLFINSIFQAYTGSLWTLTYRRLQIVPAPAAPAPPIDAPAPAAPVDLPPAS